MNRGTGTGKETNKKQVQAHCGVGEMLEPIRLINKGKLEVLEQSGSNSWEKQSQILEQSGSV